MPITEEKKQLLKNLQKFGKQEWTAYKDSIFLRMKVKSTYIKRVEKMTTPKYIFTI